MNIEELLGIRNNINEPQKVGTPDRQVISKNIFITIQEYELRGNRFVDIVLNKDEEEKFLGRFINEENKVKTKYNNGKILMYLDKFIENKMQVTKIFSLYDILDDTFYSVTELEALNLFDKNIDANYLKNKDNLIVRTDLEKKKRIKG